MRHHRTWLGAGIAGALTMFVWGGFSHMVLLKGVGFSRLENEGDVIAELRVRAPAEGLYFFPSLDFDRATSAPEQAAWGAAFRSGPTGMLLYHPDGGEPFSPRKLLVQAMSSMLAGLIAAWVVSLLAATSFARRVLVVASLGAFSWLCVSTIYWNWYGFPDAFYLAQGIDMLVGWALAGAVIAWVLARRARSEVGANE